MEARLDCSLYGRAGEEGSWGTIIKQPPDTIMEVRDVDAFKVFPPAFSASWANSWRNTPGEQY